MNDFLDVGVAFQPRSSFRNTTHRGWKVAPTTTAG